MAKVGAIALVALAAACGKPASRAASVEKKDAGAGSSDATPTLALPAPELGLADLEAFRWRKRAGQPAFRKARVAEGKGDWAGVVDLCQQALAADPGHLDAAWLLAVGEAKLGKLDQVLAPLQRAAAGDLAKWGFASLDQPALQAFLATPTGQAWQRRVEEDRGRLTQALARAIVVSAKGDLYAYDAEPQRWHRLTRTSGAVIGALDAPAAHQIAYVTRGKHGAKLGVVDLQTAKTLRPVEVGADKVVLSYGAGKQQGFWIGSGTTWRQIDDDAKFHPLPPGTKRPSGPWLDVLAHSVRVHRLPVANIAADWDDDSLASAIKLATSNRVITAPSVGLIDGNSVAWSPDRAHLAFVTIDDHCTPGSDATAAFIADAATGAVQELERARGGITVAWLDERKLAVAGDHGVALVDVTAPGARAPLSGATGLVTPTRKPRCVPEPAEVPDEPGTTEPPDEESGETPDAPADAGVDASR